MTAWYRTAMLRRFNSSDLRVLIAVVASGCLAGFMVWHDTAANGVAFTPDGVEYLEAARSFAASGRLWIRTNCGMSRAWLKDLAPLYPILIGLGIKAGWAPLAWARIVNALCAALTAGAVSWGTLRLSGSLLAALLAGAAIATLPDALQFYSAFLSEPPCLALVTLGWFALSEGLSTESRRTIQLAAVLLSLAAIDRFAVQPLVVPAALCLWLAARQARIVIEFLALWMVLPLALALVHAHFTGSIPSRPFSVHLPPASEFVDTAANVAQWLDVTRVSGGWLMFVMALTLVSVAAAVIRKNKFRGGGVLALAFMLTSTLVLLITRSFLDVTVRVSEPRHLVLLFPLGIVTLAAALPRWVLIPVLAIFPSLHFREALLHPPTIAMQYNGGHPGWRTSETLERVGQLDSSVCLYSSSPDLIYLRYNRPSEWLPKRVEWFTGTAAPWCETLKKQQMRHPNSAYVYFDANARPSSRIVPESELAACLGGTVRTRLKDGNIDVPVP